MRLSSSSFFFVLYCLSNQLNAATLVHSSLKPYTGSECGVKTYVKSEREVCGIHHLGSKEDPLCGPARFNTGADLSCVGSDAGGRKIKPKVSIYSPNSMSKGISIDWNGVDGSTVQGGEDLKTALSSTYRDFASFGPQNGAITWVKNLNNWTCVLESQSSQQFSYASVVCTAKQYLASCEKDKFGIASYKTCEREEFGKFFNSCDDPTRVESYNSCELRKTAVEINAYIEATSANIDLLARQLATAQGNYIFGSKQAKLVSCLIKRYDGDILYEEIVQDLKNNYSSMFGLEYSATQYDCENMEEKVEYTYQGKTCKNITAIEIDSKLSLPTLSVNERYFYELCQQKQTVDTLTDWFSFQVEEADLLLSDLVSRSNTEISGKLSSFKNSIKKVDSIATKCANCRVTQVEASKTASVPPVVVPPLPNQESIEVIFDGESHPFSAGQGWDITQSKVEESKASPASGLNHIRATLNNANYWGAAAYVVDNWMEKDFSSFQKIRFQAKANKATRLKVFFVSMDNNLESNHLEFNVTTSYQKFELDLKSAVTNEYDLSKVQAIIIAVSQPGKATYLIDFDDIELIKTVQ